MRLRDPHTISQPEIMIIPMIDIMFFLLVFFIMSTLYMVNVQTVDVNLPQAQHTEMKIKVNYLVTLKKDGTLYLADEPITQEELFRRAEEEQKKNENFSVVIRADSNIDYGIVIAFLDSLKGAGIKRFGLAAEAQ